MHKIVRKHLNGAWNVSAITGLAGRSSDLRSDNMTLRHQLWINRDGQPELWYSFGTNTKFGKRLVSKAVKMWSEPTCLKFSRMADGECESSEALDHRLLQIDAFVDKCRWSNVGSLLQRNSSRRKCQQMCTEKENCFETQVKALLARSLGLLPPSTRPDRDSFVVIHHENLISGSIPVRESPDLSDWTSLQTCSDSVAAMAVPVPYNFWSILQHPTHHHGYNGEYRAVQVTRDRSKQYILDYHADTCQAQSHLDLYQVHMAYGCDKRIAKNCKHIGRYPPKCLHYGYLKKDCTCACSINYIGDACETVAKNTTSYLQNAWFMHITDTGKRYISELGMHAGNVTRAASQEQGYYQFLTVTVMLAVAKKHVSINLSHTLDQRVTSKLHAKQESFIEDIKRNDCQRSLVIYWGPSRRHHLRTECLSSIGLNEPSARVFRSRTGPSLDLTFESRLGLVTGDPQLSVDLLQFQLEVSSFAVPGRRGAAKRLERAGFDAGGASEWSTGTNPLSSNGTAQSGNVTEQPGNVTVAPVRSSPVIADGAAGILAALLLGLLLLVAIGLAALWIWYQRWRDGDSWYSDSSESVESADESENRRSKWRRRKRGSSSSDSSD